MPAAGRKRVEGGLPILSQSVAIGRAETEDKAPKKVAFRRTGRNRSQSVAFRRTGRQPKQKTRRRKSRVSAYRSQSVAIGRDWSRLVAPKQKTRRRKSRNRSRLVAPKQKTRSKHKKSPIPQSGIRLHNVARRRALLAFNELLAQIHVQALEAFC